MEGANNNSFFYWYPFVKDLSISQPETILVRFPKDELHKYLNPESDVFMGQSVELVKEAIKDLGKEVGVDYPVFIRTDQSSGKHQWDETCFVESEAKLERCLCEIMLFNHLADMMGLPFTGFVVREYIEMDSLYRAFGNMPVNPERRYFIKDGEVVCHHPYWFEGAIGDCSYHKTPLPENWKELSATMNFESDDEILLLSNHAKKIAKVLDGFWSVDFCKSRDGLWYMIDMAMGEQSWHPVCMSNQAER